MTLVEDVDVEALLIDELVRDEVRDRLVRPVALAVEKVEDEVFACGNESVEETLNSEELVAMLVVLSTIPLDVLNMVEVLAGGALITQVNSLRDQTRDGSTHTLH